MSGGQRSGRRSGRGAAARQPATGGKTTPRGAGAYPRDLVPVALAGDYVHLKPDDVVRQVETTVVIPTLLAFDSGKSNGVTANSNDTTADQEATELEQRNNWLAQYRLLFPQADIPNGIDEVRVDLGGAQAPLFTTKQQRGFYQRDTSALAGYAPVTELYILEDEAPQFSFVNSTGSNITIQDMRFGGYQFELGPPTDAPQDVQPVVLPTEAIGSVGS